MTLIYLHVTFFLNLAYNSLTQVYRSLSNIIEFLPLSTLWYCNSIRALK